LTRTDGAFSADLLQSASSYFGVAMAQARKVIKDVASATCSWRETAMDVGARPAEITRMASAFEHDEHRKALAL
jgi:serine/threonine-protein kinase HipA